MELNELKILLKVYGGSKAYGTDTPQSDVDIRGIVIPPDECVIGLSSFEQWETMIPGDVGLGITPQDIVLHDFRKFFKLLLQGNPAVLEICWAPIIECDKIFVNSLRKEVWQKVISKRLIKPHLGMVQAHLSRITKTGKNCGAKGKEAIAKFGYNTKDASHLIRVLEQCKEILTTGELTLPRPNAEELLDIKNGQWKLESIKNRANNLIVEIKKLEQESTLPNLPDFKYIEQFVMDYWLIDSFCISKNSSIVAGSGVLGDSNCVAGYGNLEDLMR